VVAGFNYNPRVKRVVKVVMFECGKGREGKVKGKGGGWDVIEVLYLSSFPCSMGVLGIKLLGQGQRGGERSSSRIWKWSAGDIEFGAFVGVHLMYTAKGAWALEARGSSSHSTLTRLAP